MKKHKIILLITALILVAFATVLLALHYNSKKEPEYKTLPNCEFDGTRFVNKPCYKPPGATYL